MEKNALENSVSNYAYAGEDPERTALPSDAPLISVIIPVYKVEAYLHRCLDSVIHNTYKKLEIICVNDGSPDHSLQILKEYAEKDSRIRIVDKANGGLPTARNAGIELATGELIAHIDSDDWIHRQYFEILVDAWEKSGRKADVVMCGFVRTGSEAEDSDIDNAALEYRTGSWDLVRKNRFFRVYVWAKLYKRSLIGDFRQNPRISLEEDVLYNLNVLGKKEDLVVASVENCQLYYYYQREESIVHASDCVARIPAIKEMLSFAEKLPAADGRIVAWEEIFKHALYLRYDAMFRDRAHPEEAYDYKNTLRLAWDSLRAYKAYSPRRLFAYRLLAKYPLLFRANRIRRDPGLIKWEKQERQKYKSKPEKEQTVPAEMPL